jgi:hypothetical protein
MMNKENMKMKKIMLLIGLTLLANSARAQTQEFGGGMKVEMMFTGGNLGGDTITKTKSTGVHASLIVNTWGEDKIAVLFQIDHFRSCIGTATNYVGYGTASNTYDLYLKTSGVMPTPANSSAVATLMLTSSSAYLHFTDGFNAITSNSNGPCQYSLTGDSQINLKKTNE